MYLLSSKKMQRYPHRTVPRASSDTIPPTSHIGQCLGPLARPVLPGCLWKWVGKNIQRLQKILNFALRAVSGRRKFDHISDVWEELGWPTARQLYELHSLNFLHKIRCTGEPETLSSQLLVNSSLRSRSTRQDADLALPRARTESGRRRLLFGIVQLYNRLPPEMRNLSLGCFKRSVSEFLLT